MSSTKVSSFLISRRLIQMRKGQADRYINKPDFTSHRSSLSAIRPAGCQVGLIAMPPPPTLHNLSSLLYTPVSISVVVLVSSRLHALYLFPGGMLQAIFFRFVRINPLGIVDETIVFQGYQEV